MKCWPTARRIARATIVSAPSVVSRSLRILFVTHNFPRYAGDAAGSFVLRLARALMDAGADVHVLAPAATGLAEHDAIEGVSVRRVRYAREDRQTLAYEGTMAEAVRGSWSGRWAFVALLWHLRTATREAIDNARRQGEAFDVVHAHWWFPAGLALWLGGIGRGGAPPLVITMHGSDVRLARSLKPAHAIMRRVLGRARVVTAVSRWLADEARQIASSVAVQVAPMPVDTDRFASALARAASAASPEVPTDASAHVTQERARVLFVGRLNAQKGAADLIDALARTVHDVSCDIVGDGPDRAPLEQIARSLGVESRILWHGALTAEQLPALYQSALVTVMPSREEGLGLVAVESQLCGTPVIGYSSGGLPDVVNPEAGGTLVPAGDTAALARAIDSLASAPEHAASLGMQARAHMTEVFSPQRAARRYLEFYETARQRTHG